MKKKEKIFESLFKEKKLGIPWGHFEVGYDSARVREFELKKHTITCENGPFRKTFKNILNIFKAVKRLSAICS